MYYKIQILLYQNKINKVKVMNVVPVLFSTEHHTMKAYWRSRGTAPHVPDLGTRWR
jgi:hypothetical protein